MKPSLFILLCSGLLSLVTGFTKDDHEIFRLRDEIEASEGPEVTFYGRFSRLSNPLHLDLPVSFSRIFGGHGQRFSR